MKKTVAIFTLGLVSSFCQADTAKASQDVVNELNSLVASAELLLAVDNANQVIQDIETQAAFDELAASVANAELTLALADASEAINAIPDAVMLADLDQALQSHPEQANDMIMSVISERPLLASAVESVSAEAGVDGALVATAIANGLGAAQATAAGK